MRHGLNIWAAAIAIALAAMSVEAQAGAVLLGLWKLEENAASQTAVDSAAKGLVGTYNSGVNPNVEGAPGFGLGASFSNPQSTIGLTDPKYSLSQLTNNFSVEAWINPDLIDVRQRVFSNSTWGFGIDRSVADGKGTLVLTTYGVKDYYSTTGVLPAGVWSHVAAVIDGNNQTTFYVNGIPVGNDVHSSPGMPSNSTSSIGSGSEYFRGRIDEVAVFSGTLTQAEIQSDMQAGVPTPKQTVFRYDYNSSEPLSRIRDDSGAGHSGHTGSGTYSADIPRGFSTDRLPGGTPLGTGDRSMNTSGGGVATDALGLVTNEQIAAAGGFTIETWVCRTRDSNGSGVEKIIDLGGCYRLQLDPDSDSTGDRDTVLFNMGTGSALLPVGQWHHLVGVFDTLGQSLGTDADLSGVARFFYDGQQIGVDSAVTLSGSNSRQYLATRSIGIGMHPTGGEPFQGLLYDTRVVLGVLSPGEFLLAPEPGSLSLVALGALGLCFLQTRRRAKVGK